MPQKQKTAHLQRAATNETSSSQFSEETEEAEAQTEAATTYAVSNTELRRSIANPYGASRQAILGLQMRYGNQAVQRMLLNTQIQRVRANRAQALSGDAKKIRPMPTLINLLENDHQFNNIFLEYSTNESTTENLTAFNLLLQYKKDKEVSRLRTMVKRFFDPFTNHRGKAEQVINVKNQERLKINNAMNQGDYPEAAKIIENEIMSNISDSFQRFTQTEAFKNWKEERSYFGDISITL